MLKYIFENQKDKKTIDDMLKGKKDLDDFWSVIRILQLEFSYYYPEEFSKYFGWCSIRKINLPEKDFNAFTQCKNYKEIIKTCLNYI